MNQDAKRSIQIKPIKFGCHCDLEPGMEPDNCVFENGDIEDCVYAMDLQKKGKGNPSDCEFWKTIELDPKTEQETIESLQAEITRLTAEVERLKKDADRKEDAIYKLRQWALAYPIEVFPEPDFKKAEEVLKAAGIGISSISASAMRHVITRAVMTLDAAMQQEEVTKSIVQRVMKGEE
jgi:hypothetical protein